MPTFFSFVEPPLNEDAENVKPKRVTKRKAVHKDSLQMMYEDHKKRQMERDEMRQKLLQSEENLFFSSCAERMKKLPGNIKNVLQIQIQQLFYNAESTDGSQMAIMPLPHEQPSQINRSVISSQVPPTQHQSQSEVPNSQVFSSAMSVLNTFN